MGDDSHHEHGGAFVLHERTESFAPHPHSITHTEYGITLLLAGRIRMEHGTELIAGTDSLTIVPAGVPHRVIEGSGLDYWMVGFCPNCYELDEGQRLMEPFVKVRLGQLPTVQLEAAQRDAIVRRMQDLGAELERQQPESQQLVRAHLEILLGEVRRAMQAGPEGLAPSSLVAEVLSYIQRHCLDGISLKDVAEALGRSPAHLTSSVKKATGYSVGDWIRSHRVSEASKRLLHTDESIEEIAGRVGWQDTTHFIRQFKKAQGCTPAAWRKSHRRRHRG